MAAMTSSKRLICRRTSLTLVWMSLLLLTTFATFGAPPPWKKRTTQQWEENIQAFEEADRKSPPPTNAVVFVGSSSIRMWKTLHEDFPRHQVIQRGFGGSILIDSLYFADRIITPYQPRMVVVYAGANDISSGKTPAEVEGDFRALTAKIHTVLPKTRIAFIGIAANPKRWSQRKEIRDANDRVEHFCNADDRLLFVDAFNHMLGSDGLPLPDIYLEDRLHMNQKGYALWVDLIEPLMPQPNH